MTTLLGDIRYGVRTLARNRQLTLAALAALALGIGGNAALFTVVNAVLLQPLPFRDADRLVLVSSARVQQEPSDLPLSLPEVVDVREQSRVLDDIAAWSLGRFNVAAADARGDRQPELVQYAVTTANLFAVLGVQPAVGRAFGDGDDRAGAPAVAIVSHALWQRRFGGDRGVVGRPIALDGRSFTIIGIMPAGFRFLSYRQDTDIWMPLGSDPFVDRRYARGVRSMAALGRLKPHATLREAQTDLDTIAARLAQTYPGDNRGRVLLAMSLRDQTVKHLRPAILVLLGAVGFVLLIACANVANLLLARATTRQREMAIRAALGAGRGRLVRQLLTEHAVLGIVGGGCGLLVASWSLDLLAVIPRSAPSLFVPYAIASGDIHIDRVVLAFTAALSLGTALVFGLTPALAASRVGFPESLKGAGGASTATRSYGRLRAGLVIGEIALSLTLVVGAGLLVRTFVRLQQVDPGFDPGHVLTFDVNLSPESYASPARAAAFFDELVARLARAGGVDAAGAAEFLPLSGVDSSTPLIVDGRPPSAPGDEIKAHYRSVTPSYFRTMGISIRAGRALTDRDATTAPRVAVVNETMARQVWGGRSPIGQRVAITLEALRYRPDGPPARDVPAAMREVVGVVADVKHVGLREQALPEIYMPAAQRPVRSMSVVVRTAGDPLSAARDARRVVASIDPDQPIANLGTVSDLLAASIAQPRFTLVLLATFALVAVLLAVVGVYSVMAYSVAIRTREIGVRIALGGQARDIAGLVVSQGMRLAAAGVALGLAGAVALGRVMSGLLFGVSATDGVTFAASGALLGAVAIVACYLPARRATRIDPMQALRAD